MIKSNTYITQPYPTHFDGIYKHSCREIWCSSSHIKIAHFSTLLWQGHVHLHDKAWRFLLPGINGGWFSHLGTMEIPSGEHTHTQKPQKSLKIHGFPKEMIYRFWMFQYVLWLSLSFLVGIQHHWGSCHHVVIISILAMTDAFVAKSPCISLGGQQYPASRVTSKIALSCYVVQSIRSIPPLPFFICPDSDSLVSLLEDFQLLLQWCLHVNKNDW